ncbi:hypothetical protein ACFQZO_22880 [Bradyrhizobium sp. GCM10027634]|uniref:hypothetical protein n=1 Tax=unclassified Bradyrhizobium TaxID=2631580 RepID=UPI00188A7D1E|nr:MULTISPECIES: hypothetical protein [unclassified Bradyrhizobium]MDN5003684.1 hypothetical protein [Bradyrhizobium sp. WYCCWR 12677]
MQVKTNETILDFAGNRCLCLASSTRLAVAVQFEVDDAAVLPASLAIINFVRRDESGNIRSNARRAALDERYELLRIALTAAARWPCACSH